jgi:hypothetical protein
MIEAYAFLVAFAALILAGSVLSPAKLIKNVRAWETNIDSERFAQLYPGVDYRKSVESFVSGYRTVNIVIAALGLPLLGWLFTLIQKPDWADDAATAAVLYFLLQVSPLLLMALYAFVRYYKVLMQPSGEVKRKATMQRRGLFDFVSPFAVYVAVLSYLLFVVIAIYLDLQVYGNESLSRQCLVSLITVTLVCALNAFIIYKYLYGRKNPLVTHEGRVHTIGLTVRGGVYGSIAITWFDAIFGTLGQSELLDWRPFALVVFFIVTTLLSFTGVTAPPRRPGADGLGESPAGQVPDMR